MKKTTTQTTNFVQLPKVENKPDILPSLVLNEVEWNKISSALENPKPYNTALTKAISEFKEKYNK